MRVCVAVPLHNAEKWLSNLILIPEYEYRFFDNASTDGTRDILRSRGYTFTFTNDLLPRTESWIKSLQFACDSGARWVKPLFVGDKLAKGLTTIQTTGPQVGVVLFRFKKINKWGFAFNGRIWKISGNLERDCSYFGPFTGPPIAIMYSSIAIDHCRHNFSQNYSDWLADFQIFETVAKKFEYIRSDLIAGYFDSTQRITHKALSKEIVHLREELQIFEKYRNTLGDINFLAKVKISVRILDLGLHRLPNLRALSITISSIINVWRGK